ncbi:MAG: hypothetical protein LC769_12870 [Chloroflexi bacterium]|nr:hypothetical protein [Chloroflexota bacterium]
MPVATTLAHFNHQIPRSIHWLSDDAHDFLFPQFSRDGRYVVCLRMAHHAVQGDVWLAPVGANGAVGLAPLQAKGGVALRGAMMGRVALSNDERALAFQYGNDVWLYHFGTSKPTLLLRNAHNVAWGL